MPDYKQCTTSLMSTLMHETTSPQSGYVLAPNGYYYGLTDNMVPYLGHLDQLRYWIQQDTDMSMLFGTGAVVGESTVSTWFDADMTTTYKFMAALQFIVTHIFSSITPNREFNLSTVSSAWQIAYTNGGSNPDGPIPPPMACVS